MNAKVKWLFKNNENKTPLDNAMQDNLKNIIQLLKPTNSICDILDTEK